MMGQHCMAHRMNLVVQVLSNTKVKLKDLLQSLYFYFSKTFKRDLEFIKLVEIVQIEVLNFCGMWIFNRYTCWSLWIMWWHNIKHWLSKCHEKFFCCSSKVELKPPLWFPHIVRLVLFASIIGGIKPCSSLHKGIMSLSMIL